MCIKISFDHFSFSENNWKLKEKKVMYFRKMENGKLKSTTFAKNSAQHKAYD